MSRTVEAASNLIAGEWASADSGETYEKRNPWIPTRSVGVYALSSAEDVARAVEAARCAFPLWRQTAAQVRGQILTATGDLIERSLDDIALAMTAEMGKPIREARAEVTRAAAIFRFFGNEAYQPSGERYESSAQQQHLYTLRRPRGVVGLITPWNFPAAIPAWKTAPALAYGNTAVLKLAREAPETGLRLARCLCEAGLPTGVLNVVTGDGPAAGASLARHPDVDALSFTGSVDTGARVRDAVVSRGGDVQLELGGHNPMIVAADADISAACEAAYAGSFWSAGQKCTATRRILLHESIYDVFCERLLERVRCGVVGDPVVSTTEVGPLVSFDQMQTVLAGISQGVSEGGEILAGGNRRGDGFLVEPTVFTDVGDNCFLSQEEVFGPVVSLYRFSSMEEAFTRANAVRFGLTASFFTNDLRLVHQAIDELEVGILHINSQTAGAEVHVPFGGLKASGFGPHEQGKAARDFFTQSVTVYEDAL
jgi:aldehyde dehydrogenase (NAD+)